MSIPNHVPFGARQAVSKRWHKAKAIKRMEREPDADTVRMRTLHAARGMVVRDGCSWKDGKRIEWRVIRSIEGRTDQFDVLVTGESIDTCGRRNLRGKYGVRL
jgi:hypothetical protein